MSETFEGNAVALLLGRKGSISLPGKNTTKILGRYAMEYPLLAANQARSVSKTFVSTDDELIMEVGRSHGAELIERPPHLCTKEALFEDALVHGYYEIKQRLGKAPDFLVILMCNACTIDSELIDSAIEALEKDPQADSAVTVSVYNMWSPLRARKLNSAGYLDPFVPFEVFGDPRTINCDRDSQGDVYFADMSLSVSKPHCLEGIQNGLLPQKWMGQKILPIRNWAGCDIDFEWQLPIVEFWLKSHGFSIESTPYDAIKKKFIG